MNSQKRYYIRTNTFWFSYIKWLQYKAKTYTEIYTVFLAPPLISRNKKEEEERKRRTTTSTTTTTIKKIQGLSQPSYIVVKPQNKERAEKTIASNTGLGKVTP